jgi:HlyD family secretion protein
VKRPWLLVLAGAAALAGIVIVWRTTSASRGTAVETSPVRSQEIRAPVFAAGKVEPHTRARVSARVIGRIERLHVREGDLVKKGQRLADLDRMQYESQVADAEAALARASADAGRAEAALQNARIKLRRAESLMREKIASKDFLEAARSEAKAAQAAEESAGQAVDQARRSLESARGALSSTVIEAPISGRVTALGAEVGQTVVNGVKDTPGTVILTISDLSALDAEVDVDPAAVPRVAAGQAAEVTVEEAPAKNYEGRVAEIRGSTARIRLEKPDEQVRPGMKARARIEAAGKPNALVVPIVAVVERRPPRKVVYRIERGRARAVPVTVGLTSETQAEIISGLREGETIISGPSTTVKSLRDGEKVSPSPEKRE